MACAGSNANNVRTSVTSVGFVAILSRHDDPATGSSLLTSIAKQLAPDHHFATAGRLSLAVDAHSTIVKGTQHIRIAYGSSAPAARTKATFTGWIESSQGAFAVLEFDCAHGQLHVARDRFGAVPVYLLDTPELTAISTRRACLLPLAENLGVDPEALLEAIRFRWITGRSTLHRGISQLLPGEAITIGSLAGELQRRTWAPLQFSADGPADLRQQTSLLREAMLGAISDLIGSAKRPAILLSGGVDSSVIAALAREVRPDVRCFIARLSGDGVEELRRARFVAELLGLPLEEVEFDTSRLLDDFHRVLDLLEEPPRNPNNLVLVQLYEAMGWRGVDCALNGDGAEMLLGLADTRRVERFSRKQRASLFLPGALRSRIASMLRATNIPVAWRISRILDMTPREFALALDEIDYPLPLRRILSEWGGALYLEKSCPRADLFRETHASADFDDALHAFQCATTLLSTQRRHECIARAVGIESITPFVHTRVLEVARQLPRELRYTDRSRPVLKQLCDELVHPDVARWEKLGFSVPWAAWLDDPMAPCVMRATSDSAIRAMFSARLVEMAADGTSPEWTWTLIALHGLLDRPTARLAPR